MNDETKKRKYTKRRESWGSKRKLPSGRYQVSYVGPDGERYPGPHTFDTLGDARAWLNGVKRTIDSGKWRNPKAISAEKFKPYTLAWIEQRVSSKGEHLRPNTRAEYRRYLDKGLAPFADMALSNITPAAVRAWHLERSKSGKTAAALEARLLRAVFTTAVEDGIVEKNPVDSRLCKTSAGKAHRAPTSAELQTMLDSFEEHAARLRLAVLLAAWGGLRLSEWRALRRSDLGFDGERYTVNVTRQAARSKANWKQWIVGPPKSAEGERVVYLPKRLTADVVAHLAEHVGSLPESLLFTPAGEAEFLDDRTFNRAFDRARVAACVRRKVEAEGEPARFENDVTEHDLRAYAGTMYARSGATLRETMAFLGHSTTEAAMTYQRTTGRAAELADRMGESV